MSQAQLTLPAVIVQKGSLSHAELVERGCKWALAAGKCVFAVPEFKTIYSTQIPDVYGFRRNMETLEIECKASRSDFLADKRKKSRKSGHRMAHHRYYLCEKNVINPDDLTGTDWGLLWVKSKTACSVIVTPVTEACERKDLKELLGQEVVEGVEASGMDIAVNLLRRVQWRGLVDQIIRNHEFEGGRNLPFSKKYVHEEIFGGSGWPNFGPKYIGSI